MGDYQKIQIKKYPTKSIQALQDDETRYWKKFKNSCHFKEFAPVTSISFSPVKPHDFCIASSTRLKIYSPRVQNLKKTISRFQDVANCGSYRNDGRLIVAGDNSGLVQIFDINSRSILRSFKEHSASVHAAHFLPSNTHVVSVSDDRSIKVYDIAEQSVVLSYDNAHSDYIRSCAVSKTNPNILVSGSYDRLIKVWDIRTPGSSILTLDHSSAGMAVEAVHFFPGDSVLASSAGNQLFIWDILGGASGRILHNVSNHQKTITSIAFNSSYSRMFTGSLDHQVKVYKVSDYSVTHSFKYPTPILSLAVSPDDAYIVTGAVSGLISVRERTNKDLKDQQQQKQQNIWHLGPRLDTNLSSHDIDMKQRPGSYKFFLRGRHKIPSKEDFIVSSKQKPRLLEFEKRLKSFEHSKALDAALTHEGLPPESIISLILELKNRPEALQNAIAGRDDVSLEPILRFVWRYIKDPRFSAVLIDLLDMILNVYEPVLHSSPIIANLVSEIALRIKQEVKFQSEIQELTGAMDMIMAFNDCTRNSI